MKQPPAHSLEVHAAELAHDVWRIALRAVLGSAFDPRSHAINFVGNQVGPVIAIDVALLAIEVGGLVHLVSLHLFLCVE